MPLLQLHRRWHLLQGALQLPTSHQELVGFPISPPQLLHSDPSNHWRPWNSRSGARSHGSSRRLPHCHPCKAPSRPSDLRPASKGQDLQRAASESGWQNWQNVGWLQHLYQFKSSERRQKKDWNRNQNRLKSDQQHIIAYIYILESYWDILTDLGVSQSMSILCMFHRYTVMFQLSSGPAPSSQTAFCWNSHGLAKRKSQRTKAPAQSCKPTRSKREEATRTSSIRHPTSPAILENGRNPGRHHLHAKIQIVH